MGKTEAYSGGRRLVMYWPIIAFLATPAISQEFPDLPTINPCGSESNQDRWAIRRPTLEEAERMGNHVLIFEYWNKLARCSRTLDETIIFEGHEFNLSVNVGGQGDSREIIVLTPHPDTPYISRLTELRLDDGADPGEIILDPLFM